MTALQDLRITGAKMSCSRVGDLQNLAVDAGNGLNPNQKRKGVPLYCLIPHPPLPRRPLLDLKEEGWEGGEGGPEEREGGCLRVRESDRLAPKAGARLPPPLDREEQLLLEAQKGLGHSRMGWTISVETAVVSLPWPPPTPHHHLTTSRTPVSTFPLILPTPPPLPLKSAIQPYILESPPPPSLPVFHHPLTHPSPLLLLHPSPTILSPPRLSPLPVPLHHD